MDDAIRHDCHRVRILCGHRRRAFVPAEPSRLFHQLHELECEVCRGASPSPDTLGRLARHVRACGDCSRLVPAAHCPPPDNPLAATVHREQCPACRPQAPAYHPPAPARHDPPHTEPAIPPIRVVPYGGTERLHVGAFALRLQAVAACDRIPLKGRLLLRQSFTERLLQAVVTPGSQAMLEVRWLLGPNGAQPFLLGLGLGSDEPEAAAAARNVADSLRLFFSVAHDAYDLVPVDDPGPIVAPFLAACVVEYCRDGIPVPAPDAEHFLVPLPLPPFGGLLDTLSELPATLSQRLALCVRVRSLADTPHALHLRNRLHVEAGLHTAPTARLHPAVAGRLLSIAHAPGAVCDVRVLLASDAPVPPSIAALLGREIFGPDSRAWRMSTHPGKGHRRPWGWAGSAFPPAQILRTTCDLPEAAALFALPTPETALALGLDVRPERVPLRGVTLPSDGALLGRATDSGRPVPVHLQDTDLARHVYVIGQTGTGKSTLLSSMILSQIRAGEGVAVLDPHGDLVDALLPRIPPERLNDVILFDPADEDYPIGLNLLEGRTSHEQDFIVQEAVLMFYRLFDPNRIGMIGPRFEHWMRSAALTLMANPDGGTIVDIPRLFFDEAFRESCLRHVTDPVVLEFWRQEMAKTADWHKSEMYGYFVSKFGRFRSNRLMRNILGQPRSAFNLREVMDRGHILLATLSRGRLGEVNSSLLGTILVTRLFSAALSRANIPGAERRPFHLFIDEFQLFTTETLAQVVAESRKYALSLCLAHQNFDQLDPRLLRALLGNVGNLVAFRPGVHDVERILPYFESSFTRESLLALPNHHACARLMFAGHPAPPFLLETVLDTTPQRPDIATAIRDLCRFNYATPHPDPRNGSGAPPAAPLP